MTLQQLEVEVLSKLYFDPDNLIVATDDGQVVGMVHVVPGLPWDESPVGYIPMLNVESPDAEAQLMEAAEQRLISLQFETVLLGGFELPGPYYFGLIGGSCNRGILASDQKFLNLAESRGYQLKTSWTTFERSLKGFRPPVDRGQIAARRSKNVRREDDAPYASWEEACIYLNSHRVQFTLCNKADSINLATITAVQMDAFSHLRGVRIVGLVGVQSLAELPEAEVKFFLSEVCRQLGDEGNALVEVQIPSDQHMLRDVLQDLQLQPTQQQWEMQKSLR